MDPRRGLPIWALFKPLAVAVAVSCSLTALIGLIGSWNMVLISQFILRFALTIGVFWVIYKSSSRWFESALLSWSCVLLATAAVVAGTVIGMYNWDAGGGAIRDSGQAVGLELLAGFNMLLVPLIAATFARYWLADL